MATKKGLRTAGLLYLISGLLMTVSALISRRYAFLAIGLSLITLGIIFQVVSETRQADQQRTQDEEQSD